MAEAERKQANIRIAQVKTRVHDLADIEKMNSLIKGTQGHARNLLIRSKEDQIRR